MKKLYLLSVLLLSAAMPLIINAQVPGITWQHCYGGDYNEAFKNLNGEESIFSPVNTKGFIRAKSGGYFIAGQTNSSNGDIPISFKPSHYGVGTLGILRIDEANNVVWSKTVGGASGINYDDFGNIQETLDEGCIVIGSTQSTDGQAIGNHGGYDMMVVKLSKAGAVEWSKCYGGTADEVAYNIRPTADKGYFFTGSTKSNDGQVSGNHGNADIWLVKIDSIGNLVWQKCLGTAGADIGFKIESAVEGGYLMATANSGCAGTNLLKVDDNGNILWSSCVPLVSFGGMAQLKAGGYILAGMTSRAAIAVKLSADGTVQWQKVIDGTGDDAFHDVIETSEGNYAIAGSTSSKTGSFSGNHGSMMHG